MIVIMVWLNEKYSCQKTGGRCVEFECARTVLLVECRAFIVKLTLVLFK